MQDFSIENCRHLTTDPGSSEKLSIHRYYEFRMSARDLARFGLLFLREGRWDDHQIVPREWIRVSTKKHSIVGREGGYGYM
jgi:CubicO group peptidase (beta-lactamase class C family)